MYEDKKTKLPEQYFNNNFWFISTTHSDFCV